MGFERTNNADADFAVVQAGMALKLISGAVPFVEELAGLAGAALTAGDRSIQTRHVVKVILILAGVLWVES